jgi:hypothetical protein
MPRLRRQPDACHDVAGRSLLVATQTHRAREGWRKSHEDSSQLGQELEQSFRVGGAEEPVPKPCIFIDPRRATRRRAEAKARDLASEVATVTSAGGMQVDLT